MGAASSNIPHLRHQLKHPYAMKPVLSSQTTIRPIHNPMPENIDTAATFYETFLQHNFEMLGAMRTPFPSIHRIACLHNMPLSAMPPLHVLGAIPKTKAWVLKLSKPNIYALC